jgi:hypothetical protein
MGRRPADPGAGTLDSAARRNYRSAQAAGVRSVVAPKIIEPRAGFTATAKIFQAHRFCFSVSGRDVGGREHLSTEPA